MKKTFLIITSLLLLLCFVFSFSSIPAAAYSVNQENETSSYENTRTTKNNLGVLGISNTSVGSYKSIQVSRNGKSIGTRALFINGTYYIPLREFISKTTSMKITYSQSTKTLTVSGGGLYMSASDGAYAIYANDRVLFDITPAKIMSDGRMYIPAKTLAKALGLNMKMGSVLDFSGAVNPLVHASKFYAEDEVYWLSRIISAESRGEPLVGQIAVGNVVMNRVKSKSFPNTIWGVVFDRKYGVQFSPVANGTIYNSPAYTSVLAAKIVLEGFSLSEDIIYFIAPRHATSSWITSSRPYRFTIKNHEFYA